MLRTRKAEEEGTHGLYDETARGDQSRTETESWALKQLPIAIQSNGT